MKYVKETSSRIQLQPNVPRILAAIDYVIREASRRKVAVGRYDIVKTLFLADKAHLNAYGRPITFDNYVAMNHGPVPTTSYDLLKANLQTLKKFGIKSLPWEQKESGSHPVFVPGKVAALGNALSASDKEELSAALTIVKKLGTSQIRRLTHDDPAYAEAWKDDGAKSYPMRYDMLFDSPNDEAAQHVKFLSQHQ